MSSRDDRMSALFDYLFTENPYGATIDEIATRLGCSLDATRQAIHDLRMFLGDEDPTNLTATKQGPNERWLYRLVTEMEDHREWIANRVNDTESRLVTMQAILTSATRATDGRTLEGRRARIMHKALGRLLEDLREL